MTSIGIDFGTTNTVFAQLDAEGGAEVLTLPFNGEVLDAFRTALSFQRNAAKPSQPVAEAGPWAIQAFIDQPEDTRFLQSFKSFAASAAFTDTAIFSKRYTFDALLATFIERARAHFKEHPFPRRAVVGRPVKFAGHSPSDALARQRYDAAFRQLGFEDILYVLEPVAAAHFYAERLKGHATILVGDFGGGTSDFSIIRFNQGGQGKKAEPLGHAGVGIAGDSFDYRIIDAVVSPRLGKNATYRSWGKQLPIPVHYFANFSRWNELCLMNRPDVIREIQQLARHSNEPSRLLAFADLIAGNTSYSLYQAVSHTKALLSAHEEARFVFRSDGLDIDIPIRRADFETWIADDLERIDVCVEDVLTRAALGADDIDRVFLTGGSSYVPAVRALFSRRFGDSRIDTGEQLLSIAKGLALIGELENAGDWAAA
jgi:hypothetical chaperone protein